MAAFPHDRRLRIIVTGFLGLWRSGGIDWDYIQYPLGLSWLGHEVWYLEDTGLWPVTEADGDVAAACARSVDHLAQVFDGFGLHGRWGYRDEPTGRWHGPAAESVFELIRSADILVNVSCSTPVRDEYTRIPCRILVDTDPMFTQIQLLSGQSFTPTGMSMSEVVTAHTHHFSYGENLGQPGCRVPSAGVEWRRTRQPIALALWACSSHTPEYGFTTVMNWAATAPIAFDGDLWGQKDVEMYRVRELPAMVPDLRLHLVVNQSTGDPAPLTALASSEWKIHDPRDCVATWQDYRRFVHSSAGEFSVAKETYVKAATGWFSGRSACYLAAGRPVVTQDTGWTDHLPSGTGLLGFATLDEAAESLRAVAREPERHARAARAIAQECFGSATVLNEMLDVSASS